MYSNNLLNKQDNFNTKNNRLSDDSIVNNQETNTNDYININSDKNINDNTNSEANLTNKTLEDIRYEDLLKKYLENRNSDELIQISNFFDRVDGQSYEGQWHANSQQNLETFFGSSPQEGAMDLTFEKYTQFSRLITQSTTYKLRLLKGSYIDSWLQMQGFSLTFTNITLNDKTLTAGYSSYLEFGELFDKKGEIGYCDGVFTLTWNNTDNKYANRFENSSETYSSNLKSFNAEENEKKHNFLIQILKGSFKSNCKVDVSFELSLMEERVVNSKLTNYCIVYSIFCFLQLFNTFYLSKKIDQSNAFSNGVNIY